MIRLAERLAAPVVAASREPHLCEQSKMFTEGAWNVGIGKVQKVEGASAVPVVLLVAALDVDGLAGAGREARHVVGRVLVLQVLVVRGLLPAQVPVVRGLVIAQVRFVPAAVSGRPQVLAMS